MRTRSPLINVLMNATEKAARPLMRDFSELENLQVSKKGPADFVTHADIRTEKILREELEKARPDFAFYGEESLDKDTQKAEARWIVDPIDGTTNFMRGIPHFCISIALEQKGEIIAGFIFDPVKLETFWAEKGQGAFCNGRRLRVAGRDELTKCLVATGIPFAGCGNKERFVEQLRNIMPRTAGTRRMGSAALDLAYVAAGRYDCYWEESIKPWDIAAGKLIVEEAGGRVTTLKGGDIDLSGATSILAAPHTLYPDFQKLVA